MATPIYLRAGLVLRRGGRAPRAQVRELQRDLRGLGYLKSGLDGKFGPGTERAVKALQHDLLSNFGTSSGGDGDAPVRVIDYNRGRVVAVDGRLTPEVAGCIVDMLADARFPRLPRSGDPVEENRAIVAKLRAMVSREAPIPFVLAIAEQESNLKHFHEPRGADEDSYITVGQDTNAGKPHIITSRGYGLGQYTLFHHPPTKKEVSDFMRKPERNLERAIGELRGKFDGFLIGPPGGTRADDRFAEIGGGKLRHCRFDPSDPRYLVDCVRCVREAGTTDIVAGETPLYPGSPHRYEPTPYHRARNYRNVPLRRNVGCDWPYAVRRYNGSGVNSYHYQTKVLLKLARQPLQT